MTTKWDGARLIYIARQLTKHYRIQRSLDGVTWKYMTAKPGEAADPDRR